MEVKLAGKIGQIVRPSKGIGLFYAIHQNIFSFGKWSKYYLTELLRKFLLNTQRFIVLERNYRKSVHYFKSLLSMS